MDPARFQRLMTVFEQACAIPPGERAAFVVTSCRADGELLDEVMAMLSHDAEPAVALGADAAGGGARLLAKELARTDAPQDAPSHAELETGFPATIGRYRITRKIGEGGMGAVFEARQESPRRTVAIKIIRPGLTSSQLERRFEHEAHVLGRLQHPGIAQIFESGAVDTPNGRQLFLAMEYVPGRHLTDHADAQKLDSRQRMELLALVCDAVQHAHQRGVIHRDLKPANILVVDQHHDFDSASNSPSAAAPRSGGPDRGTREPREPWPQNGPAAPGRAPSAGYGRGRETDTHDSLLLVPRVDPADAQKGSSQRRQSTRAPSGTRTPAAAPAAVPKILDFGVARVIDADLPLSTMSTAVGQIVGTLPYMSPEQVSGNPDDVDTRSDVYALGVILYKLLSGRLPYDLPQHSPAEAARVIRDEAPRRLSSIDRVFRGDVEVIVERALDKNKARRYQSAADLAADIRRYLDGEPIEARRDSAMYVLRKQMRRYRGAVIAALMFVVALIAFAAYATYEADAKARLASDEAAARQRAESAGAAAHLAREDARISEARALSELRISNVERGRLLGRGGSMRLAEDLLWREHLLSPESPYTRWALWELYSCRPCLGAVAPPGSDPAKLIDVSTDGRVLVTAGQPSFIHFWELDTGQRIGTLSTEGRSSMAIALHPTLPILAQSSHDGRIALWNLTTGELIADHAGVQNPAYGLTYSSDGRVLVSAASDAGVIVREPTTGREVSRVPMNGVPYHIALDDPARRIAVVTMMGDIHILDLQTRRELERFHAHTRYSQGLAFSPDGSRLISAGDKLCKVWDVSNTMNGSNVAAPAERCVGVMAGSNETIRAIAFSPDGRTVATGGWWQIDIWEANGGRHVTTLTGHREQITALQFVARGDRIISGSNDGTARIWELSPAASRLFLEGHTGQVSRACFSPDLSLLASCGNDGTIRLWRPLTGESLGILGQLRGTVHAVQFMPDGRMLISTGEDGTIRLWDLATRTCIKTIFAQSTDIYDCQLLADGRSLLTAGAEGMVRIWQLPSGDLQTQWSYWRRTIGVVSASADGNYLLTAPYGRGVEVMDRAHDDSTIALSRDDSVWVAAISPDGRRVISGLWSGAVDIYDLPARKRICRHDAFDRLTTAVAISPDHQLAAAATVDGTIKIMDLNSPSPCLATLTDHRGLVSGLSFSADGRLLASASVDGRVGVWDLQYYNRHMAGNLKDALRLHREAITGDSTHRDAVLHAWADATMRQCWPLLNPGAQRESGAEQHPIHVDPHHLKQWDQFNAASQPAPAQALGTVTP